MKIEIGAYKVDRTLHITPMYYLYLNDCFMGFYRSKKTSFVKCRKV